MRTLLFKNNVHSTEPIQIPGEEKPRAINLTVRKGLKWADLKAGDTVRVSETGKPLVAGDETYAVIYDIKVMPFLFLIHYPKLLEIEHDPYCQKYAGLFDTMRKVYDGFLPHEVVTLVLYEIIQDTHSRRPLELE